MAHGARFPRSGLPLYSWDDKPRDGAVFPDNGWVSYRLGLEWINKIEGMIRSELKHLSVSELDSTVRVFIDFYKSVVHLCATEFEPVPQEYDFDFELWLRDTTSYTEKDKEHLRDQLEKDPNYDPFSDRSINRYVEWCLCFIKAEYYPTWKYPRPIKSRTDRWKCHVGPWFNAINKVLFAHPFFIKKIPLNERSVYMKNLLMGFSLFNCTDFSKFEAHFIACVMEITEFVFYDYVLQRVASRAKFMGAIRKVICGRQFFKYHWFSSSFKATRASGEMCTSCGNGFSNFAVFNYLCRFFEADDWAAVFEGDDSVNSIKPSHIVLRTQDYEDLGWDCKLMQTEDFSTASFCGIVADNIEMIQVTDVRESLVTFAWAGKKYLNSNHLTLMSLLRAKGYSMVYQYPGCPILDALGHYALRITDDAVIHSRMLKLFKRNQLFPDRYKAELYQDLFDRISRCLYSRPKRTPSGPRTRDLVYKLYGVSLDVQFYIELTLDSKDDLDPLILHVDWPNEWTVCYDRYVFSYNDMFATLSHPMAGSISTVNACMSAVEASRVGVTRHRDDVECVP